MSKISQNRFVRQVVYALERPSFGGRLSIDPDSLESVKTANRAFLRTVDRWIADVDYENSIFQYGLPQRIRPLIDLPMTEETSYSDMISCLARAQGARLRYLEIGVSVGKNFAQVLQNSHDAELTAFDIESINPKLESMLAKETVTEWPTRSDSMRKTPSTLSEYRHEANGNRVRYLAGDVFDPGAWERLKGQSFNLVFSDAFHSAEALVREWDMLKKLDLLSHGGFVMLWDDLGGRDMRRAFYDVVEDMSRNHGLDKAKVGIRQYRGWVGANEPYHPIGFIQMPGGWR